MERGHGPLELACQRWSLTITRVNWINAAHSSPSPASWLLQFQRGHGPLWELACQRWSLTITRVNWMNAAHWSPSPASWLLQFQRGHGPLWGLACQRWSLTITRVNWMNAAHSSPSPAGWLLQFPEPFGNLPKAPTLVAPLQADRFLSAPPHPVVLWLARSFVATSVFRRVRPRCATGRVRCLLCGFRSVPRHRR
ncbi:hypothetical protein D3C84_648190 [compost metagenome]